MHPPHMITSLLIDDEAPARLHLRRLLAAHTDVQIVGDAANGLEALERIAELQPRVIFLDIEMPGLPLAGRRDANAEGLRKAATTLMAPAVTKLTGRRGNRLILLSPRDVLFVAVEDQLAFLHTATDRFRTERTLAELELLLEPAGFIRISRSALVNLQHARELIRWTSGTWRIRMSNQAELEVSRERGRALKQRLR